MHHRTFAQLRCPPITLDEIIAIEPRVKLLLDEAAASGRTRLRWQRYEVLRSRLLDSLVGPNASDDRLRTRLALHVILKELFDVMGLA